MRSRLERKRKERHDGQPILRPMLAARDAPGLRRHRPADGDSDGRGRALLVSSFLPGEEFGKVSTFDDSE
jgi:hypothetical protein